MPPPHAASLIQSLRDIGYSFETALADIIDNSITAGARRVDILCNAISADPAIGILDDGNGMDLNELVEAMRPGSRNPLDERESRDLGRFGVGLKSASLSQCKKLTVVSRKNGQTIGATWDLDEIARSNRWEVETHHDATDLPWADRLKDTGTLVIWRSLDRLSGGIDGDDRKRSEHINRTIAKAERHIRLVFHRFIEEDRPPLQLALNGRELAPLDPFARAYPSHQCEPQDELNLARGTVVFQSFPFARSVRTSTPRPMSPISCGPTLWDMPGQERMPCIYSKRVETHGMDQVLAEYRDFMGSHIEVATGNLLQMPIKLLPLRHRSRTGKPKLRETDK